MWQRAKSGGGSGSVSIIPDTSNLLYHITAYNTNWTATEDCIMVGLAKGTSGGNAVVFKGTSESADNILLSGGTNYGKIGNTDNISNSKCGMFIPKDTVIHTRNRSDGTYNLYFYAVSTS